MLGYLCLAQTLLCSKNKDKKSESNSQLVPCVFAWLGCCVRRTKIKNLKAIHNNSGKDTLVSSVVFEEQR